MLILKLNVKSSTFVLLMDKVVLPSTLSSVPTVPSLTRTTSSVIGGSTLTVLRLKVFMVSMTKLLLNVTPLLVAKMPPLIVMEPLPRSTSTLLPLTTMLMTMRLPLLQMNMPLLIMMLLLLTMPPKRSSPPMRPRLRLP